MRKLICLSLFCLLASGCGEFAYKRGASAKDYDAIKKRCQSSSDDAVIEKCLADNGWVVQKLDALGLPDSELFATASVSEDNRNPTPANTSETTTSQKDVEMTETSTIAIAQTTNEQTVPKVDTSRDESASKSSNVEKVSSSSSQAKAGIPKKQAVKTVNPFEKYKINSWWKMGGGRDALELSIETCSKKLGDEHLPDRKNQIFTRAFAACMYENGWRGLREK
jgi:hypothetical protein